MICASKLRLKRRRSNHKQILSVYFKISLVHFLKNVMCYFLTQWLKASSVGTNRLTGTRAQVGPHFGYPAF